MSSISHSHDTSLIPPQTTSNDPFSTPARSTATPQTDTSSTTTDPPPNTTDDTQDARPRSAHSDTRYDTDPRAEPPIIEPTRSFGAAQSATSPPSLNYTLKGRKRWIFIFWTLIIIDSIGIPLAVYFGLWYGVGPDLCPPAPPGSSHPLDDCPEAKLNANAVFSISTA